jgi:hypothetical protein
VSFLDRLASRKTEFDAPASDDAPAEDLVFATKALRKFLGCLSSRESAVVLDLGPVVGSNVSFFCEQIGCKIRVEDVYADLDRHLRANDLAKFPAFLKSRFHERLGPIDGVLCWDLIDYLDRPSAQALADQLARLLRPEGALLGFFGTAQPRDTQYTKYVIVDPLNLKYRPYPAARGRQSMLQNRDIIRLFPSLRVSDSFLLQNHLREILFRKPAWEA